MTPFIILDTGPFGDIAHHTPCMDLIAWVTRVRRIGHVYIPDVVEYEVRRSLLRLEDERTIESLNALDTYAGVLGRGDPNGILGRLETARSTWIRAGEVWAEARLNRIPAKDDKFDLGADAIILAHARIQAENPEFDVWIATENLNHFKAIYTQSANWRDIPYCQVET